MPMTASPPKSLSKPSAKLCSNYELYADMSNRVMSVLRQFTPQLEQYSIDEAFVHFNLPEDSDYESLAMELRGRILQWTGIPTGIGFASERHVQFPTPTPNAFAHVRIGTMRTTQQTGRTPAGFPPAHALHSGIPPRSSARPPPRSSPRTNFADATPSCPPETQVPLPQASPAAAT